MESNKDPAKFPACDENWRRQRNFEEATPFNVFNSQEKTSSPLNGEFLFSQRLIEVLLRMEHSEQDRNELITICRDRYQHDQNEIDKITEYETNSEHHTPVWWYTRESCLFKLLNKAFRTEDIDILYSFRSFIQDIYTQVERLYQNGQSITKAYRFQLMKKDEIRQISNGAQQFISINSFFSTSMDQSYSQFLLQSVLSNISAIENDVEPVLFQITIDSSCITTRHYADITRESFFPNENEVLFTIGSIFQITQSQRNENYWSIDLRLCGDDENQLKEAYDYMKMKTEKETTIETLAKLLRETGKYDKAKQYYEKLLQKSDPQSKEAGYCHQGLGLIADSLGDYDQAIVNFEKHLQLHQSRPNNQFEIANAMQNLGISYDAKGEHNRALDYYRNALNIKIDLLGEEHTLIADLYYNIGITYGVQNNEEEALRYYKKALEIYERLLPADHLDIANAMSNIGCCYQQKSDLDMALEYHNKALSVKLKTIPETHEYIAREYNQLGTVHFLKGNYNLALDFLLKAKAIFQYQSILSTHVDVIDNERLIRQVEEHLHQ